MNATTLNNQGLMASGSVASASFPFAISHAARLRVTDAIWAATPKTNEVKPFHGYTRRPLEGSS